MEELPVFHGAIGKNEAERRLGLDGRNGCYLVRHSDSLPGVYCLCVLYCGIVYTYRIHQNKEGFWAAECVPDLEKRYFRHINNLIKAYQLPDQGIETALLFPVTVQSWMQLAESIPVSTMYADVHTATAKPKPTPSNAQLTKKKKARKP